MTAGSGWDGILQPGETILWQGQPVPDLRWRDMISGRLPIGVFFTLFSLFWIGMATTMVASVEGPVLPVLLFPFAGLPFLAIGLYMLAGHVVWDALVRRGTWYTLTDRTAFVATEILGRRKLDHYPLAEMAGLELVDGVPGDVIFGSVTHAFPPRVAAIGRGRQQLVRTGTSQPGFRQIAEARQVWRMIRDRRAALAQGTEGDDRT
jgi:hypothetical protein